MTQIIKQEPQAQPVDVSGLEVARVYAEGVWNLAVEQGRQAEFLEEYESLLRDVLDREPQLEVFFQLGSISQDRKEQILEHIFKGRSSELLYNFLLTLNKHDRLGLLRPVGVCLRQLRDKAEGRVSVLVRTAVPLDEGQLGAVRQMVAEKFGVNPELRAETDPGILGGLWLRVGDTVYDRSVRWNLNQLREQILTRSSYEV